MDARPPFDTRIRLSGNRRLSASVAFGVVFSAVAGFTIDMIGREGAVWPTDAHARPETPAYAMVHTDRPATANPRNLVVSIGVSRDISGDVESALPALGLDATPAMHMSGNAPIVSADQANAVVAEIKRRIAAGDSRNEGEDRAPLYCRPCLPGPPARPPPECHGSSAVLRVGWCRRVRGDVSTELIPCAMLRVGKPVRSGLSGGDSCSATHFSYTFQIGGKPSPRRRIAIHRHTRRTRRRECLFQRAMRRRLRRVDVFQSRRATDERRDADENRAA